MNQSLEVVTTPERMDKYLRRWASRGIKTAERMLNAESEKPAQTKRPTIMEAIKACCGKNIEITLGTDVVAIKKPTVGAIMDIMTNAGKSGVEITDLVRSLTEGRIIVNGKAAPKDWWRGLDLDEGIELFEQYRQVFDVQRLVELFALGNVEPAAAAGAN